MRAWFQLIIASQEDLAKLMTAEQGKPMTESRGEIVYGASFVECSLAWEALLPDTLSHPTITVDLRRLLLAYQSAYDGAMYSGCGGGYLVVASESELPGSFAVSVRTA